MWWGNNYSLLLSLITCLVFMVITYTETKSAVWSYMFVSSVLSVVFFISSSILMFYMVFELVMVPVFLAVLLYGSQPENISSIYYVIVYTGGFSIPFVYEMIKFEGWFFSLNNSPIIHFLSLGLFISKVPMYFLHVWLPKTHVEAPSSVSVLLAGVLLKVGVYGGLKMLILINLTSFAVLFSSLAGITIVSVLCCLSSESKVLTALSSVTHINFVLYGFNLFSVLGMGGSILLSLSHGLISALIFSLVGSLYHLNGTRVLLFLAGMGGSSMFMTYGMMFVYVANAGVPPILSFWGELLIINVVLNSGSFVLLFLVVFFLYSFYYSVYFILHLTNSGGTAVLGQTILVVFILLVVSVLSLSLWWE